MMASVLWRRGLGGSPAPASWPPGCLDCRNKHKSKYLGCSAHTHTHTHTHGMKITEK